MTPTTTTRIVLLPAILAIAACSPAAHEQEPEHSEPFAFQAAGPLPIDISVHGENGPVPGAIVTVRTDPTTPDAPSLLIWTGMTNPQGRATGMPSLPQSEVRVAVIVTKRGHLGPYTQEEDRSQLGPVAPAAWIRTSPDQLRNLSVTLTRRQP